MKSSHSLIIAVLFLMTTILNLLNVDFANVTFMDILPAVLFGIVSIFYFVQFFKTQKEEVGEKIPR